MHQRRHSMQKNGNKIVYRLTMIEIKKIPDTLWTAAHTKPRCEKKVLEYCEKNNITCYLPLLKKKGRYQRRTVVTYLPMFPSYIFIQQNQDIKQEVLKCQKIVWFAQIDEIHEEQLIKELNEVQRIESLQHTEDVIVQPEIVPGKEITVASGPLKGASGVVVKREKETRLVVNVEFLGQSVSVNIDVGELEMDDN